MATFSPPVVPASDSTSRISERCRLLHEGVAIVVFRVLVVTPEEEAARVVEGGFPGGEVLAVGDLNEAGGYSEACRFEYAFVDITALRPLAEEGDYQGCLDVIHQVAPGARIVVMAPPDGIREAVNIVREGASDYLTYPVVREEMQLVRDGIERRERIRSELHYHRDRALQTEALGAITSRAESMKTVLRKIRQVAPTRSTVLLTGETGTGKSFLAKVIHQHSTRAERQFVSVHCGAIPDTLLESELFGHERGAFTGADRRRLGKFEIAIGGTLFLDEIATVTSAMQVKLLNVLQERSIQRVGGERDIEVDVRILVATNMDLARLTEDGTFRNDLFYRLNVFPIEVPPLRDRREDIPTLVEGFLVRLRQFHQKDIGEVHPAVMEAFLQYAWPGNVRELENLLERAFILETTSVLTPENFPEEMFGSDVTAQQFSIAPTDSLAEVRSQAVADVERQYLKRQLEDNNGRIDATAKAAGITPRQLHKLMTEYGLKKEDFRKGRTKGTSNSER
jgi:DNA-binding NtrC family response regulator